MSIWEYLLLFSSVLIGGVVALVVRRHSPVGLRLLLSFSGAYILGIAAIHLLPGIYAHSTTYTGLWLLLGFFIQILLEQLSRGIEHGHVHAHHAAGAAFGVQILLGLCLHSFIEGMPLSAYSHLHEAGAQGEPAANHLLYGIVLHKAPAAFALVIVLMESGYRRFFVVASLVLFAFMSPLGALITEQFLVSEQVLNQLMAVVTGSFLHISTTILFEADDTHHHLISWTKLLAILSGFALALLTLG